MARPMLKAAPAERSPERASLAAAVERLQQLDRDIATEQQAMRDAEATSLEACSAFSRAERDLERARPRGPNEPPIAHDFRTQEEWDEYHEEQNIPPLPVGEARTNLERAQDAKDTARRAVQFHKDRLNRMTDFAPGSYRADVKKAAAAAVKSDGALVALVADAKRKAQAYYDVCAAIDAIEALGEFRDVFSGWDRRARPSEPEAWPISLSWRAALAELHADPDAELPV